MKTLFYQLLDINCLRRVTFCLGWVFFGDVFPAFAQEVLLKNINSEKQSVLSGQLSSEKPRYGGTLVWGTTNSPTIINPILTQNSISASLVGLLFNSLLKVDSNDQVVSDLAESWDVSSDGLTYVFHLRKGVRFHDGVELTSADVKFTYEAIADERNKSPLRMFAQVDGQWQVVDKYTIKLILRSPDSFVLRKLFKQVTPRHLLENTDLNSAVFNYQPVGTGPFRLKKWDKGSNQIELEANTDYFEGRPYLDRIIVRIYPDNTRLWAALMRQEVDFVRYLNQQDYLVLRADPTFKTYAVPSEHTCAIIYNLQDPILSDINVRKAIALGIDVEKILQRIPLNGVVSSGPFQPNVAGFNSDVQPLKYDPYKARELLNASGWGNVNGNGILEKSGQPLNIKILVDGRSEYFQRIAMLIRQQLSEIGIRVMVQLYQDETVLSKEYLDKNKVQAWLRFFRSDRDDPMIILDRWRFSSNSGGDWHYKSKTVDELINLASNIKDIQQRIRIFREIHKFMYEDQPACFLFSPLTLGAVVKRVRNTDDFFFANMSEYLIKNWYLDNSGG